MTSLADLARNWSRAPEKGEATVAWVDESRFWAKVDRRSEPNGCWPWIGAISGNGYGVFRNMRAHRIAYLLVVGVIPEERVLDHLCRNRRCCNPAHLEPVSIKENVLRGEGLPAANAIKTHCKRGHPLSGENLRVVHSRGNPPWRDCRACRLMHNRKRVWGKP